MITTLLTRTATANASGTGDFSVTVPSGGVLVVVALASVVTTNQVPSAMLLNGATMTSAIATSGTVPCPCRIAYATVVAGTHTLNFTWSGTIRNYTIRAYLLEGLASPVPAAVQAISSTGTSSSIALEYSRVGIFGIVVRANTTNTWSEGTDYDNVLESTDLYSLGTQESIVSSPITSTLGTSASFTSIGACWAIARPVVISDGLQFAYLMDEASGSRVDQITRLSLSQVGTIGSRAGLLGNAADIEVGENFLASAYSPLHRMATGSSYTVMCWVYVDSLAATPSTIICRWNGGGSTRDYLVGYDSTGSVYFSTIQGTNTDVAALSPAGVVTTGSWHLIVAWIDSSVGSFGSINIQVNNGTVYTTTLTAAKLSSDTATLFAVGRFNQSFGYAGSTDAAVDLVCNWSRVLTAEERTSLWNSGLGLNYPFGFKYPTLRTPAPVAGYYARRDSGAAADAQFGAASGTLSAGTTRANNGGLCYRHNGSTSGITTTYTTAIGTSDYTFSSWFNVANSNQFGMIFAKDSQAPTAYTQASTLISNVIANAVGRRVTGIDVSTSGTFLATPTDGTFTNSAWHHVALRRQTVAGTTTLSLWLNGTQITSSTTTLRDLNNTNALKIGIGDGSSLRLTGDTDDHLLWLAALTDADIGYLASQRGAIYEVNSVNGARRRATQQLIGGTF